MSKSKGEIEVEAASATFAAVVVAVARHPYQPPHFVLYQGWHGPFDFDPQCRRVPQCCYRPRRVVPSRRRTAAVAVAKVVVVVVVAVFRSIQGALIWR